MHADHVHMPRQSLPRGQRTWLPWCVRSGATHDTKLHTHVLYVFVAVRCMPFLLSLGYYLRVLSGELDLLYKLSATGRSSSNTCRNLHRLIHREGHTLPVEISFVDTPVRKRRPFVKKENVHYPVIFPSTWIEFLLKNQSYLLLGGHNLEDQRTWQEMLSQFWVMHIESNPTHVMSGPDAPPAKLTIPLYVHGDEGRGKYKLPIMVEGIQPCISFKGPDYKNSSGSFDHVILIIS